MEIGKKSINLSNGIVLQPLPIYHIYAFTTNVMALCFGLHSILVVNPRELKTVIDDIKKYNPSVIVGINTLFNALLNNKDFCKLDFSNFLFAQAGGMAV
jgi:long-chain acyl-CoA synthetase